MSLWVTSAIEQLSAPSAPASLDLGKMWGLIENCHEQISRAHDIHFLRNLGGAQSAYRDTCNSALALLKRADAIKVPFLPLRPADTERPEVRDSWERARIKRDEAISQRTKFMAEASDHLKQAEAICHKARDVKLLEPGERVESRQPEKVGAGKR